MRTQILCLEPQPTTSQLCGGACCHNWRLKENKQDVISDTEADAATTCNCLLHSDFFTDY